MPPKSERSPMAVDVVEISSSDDDDCVPNTNTRPQTQSVRRPQLQSQQRQSVRANSLDSRSFWKAGGYEVGPTSTKTVPLDGLEHARVHPKFLHSNATSHKWPFGAIAELIDNAVDEIQNGATYVKVDKVDIMKNYSPALLFQDDGGGMDPLSIRKCMSLGYSSKTSNTTIGQYGNGFKTSTMRLGADVIVFSRATRAGKSTQSVGLLSYTFLRRTGHDDVIVPMIDFDISSHCAEPIIDGSQDDWTANLKTILEWSPFDSKDELMQQFEDIGSHGTKIMIYNLWLNDEGVYELSLDDDDEDIRLRDEALVRGQTKVNKRTDELQSHISYRIRYSLRAYTSILYLRKFANFSIILRGKPVQQYSIADDLKYKKIMTYKPHTITSSEEIVETTIGFIKEAPDLGICGFNVYHKNRLIRPYWKVTRDGSNNGAGVVGVLEANFIEPAHDKQDFERSSLFIRLEMRLKQMVMEYWKGNCHLVGHQTPGFYQQMERLHKSKMQKQLPVRQGAADLPGMEQDRPVAGTASILPQHIQKEQHGRDNRMDLAVEVPVNGVADGSYGEAYDRRLQTMTLEEISRENIQLFARCEEQERKASELQRKVEASEKELADAKRKRDQLSADLETKRREMTRTRR